MQGCHHCQTTLDSIVHPPNPVKVTKIIALDAFPNPFRKDSPRNGLYTVTLEEQPMNPRIFPTLSLLIVLLAACAPAATPTAAPAQAIPATATVAPAIPTLEPSAQANTSPTQTSPAPLPVATSRGPELHATDPATVQLASGGLHFVEFFRFT